MAHDFQTFDGFDAYGPPGFVAASGGVFHPDEALLASEWSSLRAWGLGGNPEDVELTVVPGLFGPGQALKVAYTAAIAFSNAGGLFGTFPQACERVVFGGTFQVQLSLKRQGIVLGDTAADQVGLVIESTGQIGVRIGAHDGGSVLYDDRIALSDASISSGEAFHLEADVTFDAAAGKVKVYLNGGPTPILNLTGLNTLPSGGVACNEIGFVASTDNTTLGGSFIVVDNFYVRGYVSAGGADTPLLSNPIVETQFPIADYQIDFAFGGAILGPDYSATTATSTPGAGQLFLKRYTPDADGVLEDVRCVPAAASGSAKFKPVCYSDTAGAADSLLSAGPELVGAALDVEMVGPLTSPVALTAGTPVWLGFLGDTAVALHCTDDTTQGYKVARTYASGPPATAAAMTPAQPSWLIYGLVSGLTADFWSVVDQDPLAVDKSYMTSSGAGDEDLYEFPNLSNTPTTIYAVAMCATMKRSDSGARTIDLRIKSGATTDSGLNPGLTPSENYTVLKSNFEVDPDTAAAWNASGVNLMKGGYKIAT